MCADLSRAQAKRVPAPPPSVLFAGHKNSTRIYTAAIPFSIKITRREKSDVCVRGEAVKCAVMV